MNKTGGYSRPFLLIFLSLLLLALGACVSEEIVPDPSPQVESEPPATAVPSPEVTLSATADIPATPSCLAIHEANVQAPAGLLRVTYVAGETVTVWQEEASEPVSMTLPAGAEGVVLSADGELVAYQRPGSNPKERELWVMSVRDGREWLLTTVSLTETLTRYPQAVSATLSYHWILDEHKLAYRVAPQFDAIGEVPYEALHIADADTGETQLMMPAGIVNAVSYAPDGRQLAAVTADTLHLVDTTTGIQQFTIPVPLVDSHDQSLSYSPDGRFLVLFTLEGIALLNTTDGSRQQIPFEYERLGMSHHTITPQILWHDDSQFYTIIPAGEQTDDAQAAVTVWHINISTATATPLKQLNGSLFSFFPARFSPHYQYLAYWQQRTAGGPQELLITDLSDSEPLRYDSGAALQFLQWHPNGTRFVYQRAEGEMMWGALCQEPTPFPAAGGISQLTWVDGQRFLAVYEEAGRWTLRLQSVGGLDISIVTSDSFPEYRFYFDEIAATPNPTPPMRGDSFSPAVSADGRYVVFTSRAGDLVEGDTNQCRGPDGAMHNCSNIFLVDRQDNRVRLISRAANGQPGNGNSFSPAISGDGRWVAFLSEATNLVEASNRAQGLFLYDMQNARLSFIAPASGPPSLSADGRFIAYSAGLSPQNVYLYDRETGERSLVSRGMDGQPADGDSTAPQISADGRWLAFWSWAGNLVVDDSDICRQGESLNYSCGDVFVLGWGRGRLGRIPAGEEYGLGMGTYSLTLSADGGRLAFNCQVYERQATYQLLYSERCGQLSADGQWIAFQQGADFFVQALATGSVMQVSIASDGTPSDGELVPFESILAGGRFDPGFGLSEDGRYVVFATTAGNLDPADQAICDDAFFAPHNCYDIYLHDRETGRTEWLSKPMED